MESGLCNVTIMRLEIFMSSSSVSQNEMNAVPYSSPAVMPFTHCARMHASTALRD